MYTLHFFKDLHCILSLSLIIVVLVFVMGFCLSFTVEALDFNNFFVGSIKSPSIQPVSQPSVCSEIFRVFVQMCTDLHTNVLHWLPAKMLLWSTGPHRKKNTNFTCDKSHDFTFECMTNLLKTCFKRFFFTCLSDHMVLHKKKNMATLCRTWTLIISLKDLSKSHQPLFYLFVNLM